MSILCRLFLVGGDRGGHISQLQSLLPVLCHILCKTGTLETQKLSKNMGLCKRETVSPKCSIERFQSERFQYKELLLKMMNFSSSFVFKHRFVNIFQVDCTP